MRLPNTQPLALRSGWRSPMATTGSGSVVCAPMGVNTPLLQTARESLDATERLTFASITQAAEIIEPEEVAQMAVDAVRTGRFLVLPHPLALERTLPVEGSRLRTVDCRHAPIPTFALSHQPVVTVADAVHRPTRRTPPATLAVRPPSDCLCCDLALERHWRRTKTSCCLTLALLAIAAFLLVSAVSK
jgi:hypothetical protein